MRQNGGAVEQIPGRPLQGHGRLAATTGDPRSAAFVDQLPLDQLELETARHGTVVVGVLERMHDVGVGLEQRVGRRGVQRREFVVVQPKAQVLQLLRQPRALPRARIAQHQHERGGARRGVHLQRRRRVRQVRPPHVAHERSNQVALRALAAAEEPRVHAHLVVVDEACCRLRRVVRVDELQQHDDVAQRRRGALDAHVRRDVDVEALVVARAPHASEQQHGAVVHHNREIRVLLGERRGLIRRLRVAGVTPGRDAAATARGADRRAGHRVRPGA